MDTSSLYYFVELSKDLNMTKTAARLYISQQSLSSKLIRLEEEVGTQLFFRKPRFLLTPAGECFLQFARTFDTDFTELKTKLNEYNREETGSIRFGASTLRIDTCLPAILPQFMKKYPKVDIKITDTISTKLEPLIVNGNLDLAVVTTEKSSPVISETHLMTDQIYLCVTDSLLLQYYGSEALKLKQRSAEEGAVLADFRELPFCLFNNRLGQIVMHRFAEEHIVPRTYISSTYTSLGSTLCFQGIAASFATRVGLTYKRKNVPDDLNVFRIKESSVPMEMELHLVTNKERYLASYTNYFSDLLIDYFSKVEKIEVARTGIEL